MDENLVCKFCKRELLPEEAYKLKMFDGTHISCSNCANPFIDILEYIEPVTGGIVIKPGKSGTPLTK